jgi:pimeloyl-ACP methyl ester carboxylesterase
VEVQAGDVRLFFDVDGAKVRPDGLDTRDAPSVVIVHDGPGADHATFKHPAFARHLTPLAQLVYFDLRGHGRSEKCDAAQWSLDVWADDVRALCDALAIEKPIVFGSGFGALIATRYASRHPDHPLRLVLARPVARFDAARSVAVFERLVGPMAAEPVVEFYARPTVATYGNFVVAFMRLFRTMTPAEIAEALIRADWQSDVAIHWFAGEARTFDLRPDASRLRVPTLVLAGEDDPLMPVEGAEELASAIEPALVTFHRYAGARHSLYADEPRAMETTQAFVAEAAGLPGPALVEGP